MEYLTSVSGEKVPVKKGRFGYRIIKPIKENGKINWPNLLFGGWGNLIKLIFFIAILIIIYFGIHDLTTQCQTVINNPCNYCSLWG